jgi:hypothetical protein
MSRYAHRAPKLHHIVLFFSLTPNPWQTINNGCIAHVRSETMCAKQKGEFLEVSMLLFSMKAPFREYFCFSFKKKKKKKKKSKRPHHISRIVFQFFY